jgi:Asp-tRNA(Asn)/Glu-tRNA(Gln) amidotransferase A subunit family amidase
MKAVEELRAAGATVVIAPDILPREFAVEASHICTLPYILEGTNKFLAEYGPSEFHSADEYAKATGNALPADITSGELDGSVNFVHVKQARLEDDPRAELDFLGPKRKVLEMYEHELDRLHLDGFVYPAIQMPPPDETMPQNGKLSGGPHSDTAWVNMLGVPAISIPAGFYNDGLPFGIEISARKWHDGDLLGWAYDYELHTHHRRRPVLVDGGLLPHATKPME